MKKHKLLLFSLLAVFVAQLLVTSLLPLTKVEAQAKVYGPSEKARAYQATWWLSNCITDAGLVLGGQSKDRINGGSIVAAANLQDSKISGYLLDSNGEMSCSSNNSEKDALNIILDNSTPISDFLLNRGLYTVNANGELELKKSKNDVINTIKAEAENRYGFKTANDMPEAMQYASAKAAFDKVCNGGIMPDSAVNTTSVFKVSVAGTDGGIQNQTLLIRDTSGDIKVGHGLSNAGSQTMHCGQIKDLMNKYANSYANEVKTNGVGDSTAGQNSTGTAPGGGAEGTCETVGWALSWLACPLINALGGVLNWVDTAIVRLLTIDRKYYNGQTPEMYSAWARFRNIALSILVAAMLVMVVSTASGVGMLDAYTVKKSMPRMFASVIFIVLSWWICTTLIDFSNIVGSGVLGIMTGPFGGKASSLTTMMAPSAAGAGAQGLAILGVGLAVLNPPTLMALLSYLGVAALVMIIAFVIMILRQLFVVGLILLAPLAILSWIFPNNNKLWKFWWESFSKVLLMFPMIMALIGAGRIFAAVNASAPRQGEETLYGPLLTITAYTLPYLLIPFTFKAAGGVFGSITGMVNDRSKGAFDRLRKSRQENWKKAGHDLKSGNFYRGAGETGFRAFANRNLRRGAYAGKAGIRPGGWRNNIDSAIDASEGSEIDHLMKENQAIQAILPDDTLLKAARDGHGRAGIEAVLREDARFDNARPDELAKAVRLVEQAQQQASPETIAGLVNVASNATGTGIDSATQNLENIERASGGSLIKQGMLIAKSRSAAEGARRTDISLPGHVDQANAMAELANETATREEINTRMIDEALRQGGPHALVNMRPNAFAPLMQGLADSFNAARAAGDGEAMVHLGGQITSLRGAMGSASPAQRQAFEAMLQQVGVDRAAIDPNTGYAVSVDEQLGTLVEHTMTNYSRGSDNSEVRTMSAQQATQAIRTSAGAYDSGGMANLTPEQIAARQARPPET